MSEGRDRWQRWMGTLIGSLMAMVLVVSVVSIVLVWPDVRCGSPLDGIVLKEGECVGVSDGSFVFDEAHREVYEDIADENEWAAAEAEAEGLPLVRIALMTTLTTTQDSAMSADRIRSALDGALVALHRANRTRELGDPHPLVQLVLANEGARQTHWEVPVSELEDMSDDEVPLVAVMGQGVSSDRTMDAAYRLSKHEIPMVTGVTTADGIDNGIIPGLLRAAPSNTDFAMALRQYVDGREDIASAVLVHDNAETDLYARTLRSAYEEHLSEYLTSSHQPFPGRSIEEGGVEVFDTITQNVCESEAQAVLFAGREPDLKVFIESLSLRACQSDPLTVLFGVTGTDLQADEEVLGWIEEGNLSVLYAAGADPGWGDGAETPEGFADFQTHFENLVGGGREALANGYAVTYHDALMTAVSAVRITNPWSEEPPTAGDVRDHLLLLNSEQVVRGASGTLSFNENRDGNPGGKYVPVVPLPYPEDPADLPQTGPYITPVQ